MGIRLLKCRETSTYLNVSEQTLTGWRWRRQGPPFILVGRQVRYSEDDLSAWLSANRHMGDGVVSVAAKA